MSHEKLVERLRSIARQMHKDVFGMPAGVPIEENDIWQAATALSTAEATGRAQGLEDLLRDAEECATQFDTDLPQVGDKHWRDGAMTIVHMIRQAIRALKNSTPQEQSSGAQREGSTDENVRDPKSEPARVEPNAAGQPAPRGNNRNSVSAESERSVPAAPVAEDVPVGAIKHLRVFVQRDSFWNEQPYGTRFYYGNGGLDYLHRGLLESVLEYCKADPQVPGSARW